jgi:hypothetical protein
MERFISKNLGISTTAASANLFDVLRDESNSNEPILFITTPGADPSREVEGMLFPFLNPCMALVLCALFCWGGVSMLNNLIGILPFFLVPFVPFQTFRIKLLAHRSFNHWQWAMDRLKRRFEWCDGQAKMDHGFF